MSRDLKPGDRVRVTIRNRLAGYQPGDKGTVWRASRASATGEGSYTVEMDKDEKRPGQTKRPGMSRSPAVTRGGAGLCSHRLMGKCKH
jgi:hypothetical protein